MIPEETDVLIVGAGPVGATAALLCARFGLRSIIIEKRERRAGPPKAHALNPRSLEIYASMGISYERLVRHAMPREDGGFVRFVTSLQGLQIGALPYERQDDGALEATPNPLINIPQPALEDILLEEVSNAKAIDLRRSQTWLSAADNGARVISTIATIGGECRIASRYLLACDGADSTVRKACGIDMPGDARIEDRIMIHIEADLRPLLGSRPAVLYFITDPSSPATLIAYDLASTYVLMHRYDRTKEDAASFPPERCKEIVRRAIGPDTPFEIRHISPWTMTALVAERYRTGRIFLCGDAAHRFPPSGGLGLNSGMQDAHNLVWKLAAVERGWCDESLLDSYQRERQPVAAAYSAQSHGNALRMGKLFGFVASEFTDAGGDRAQAERRLSSPELRPAIDELIELQRPHFDSFGLQIGFRYGDRTWTESVSDFMPQIVDGVRMPHAWIEIAGKRASSLDLLDPATFTLICAPAETAWNDALSDCAAPLRICVSGVDFLDVSAKWAGLLGGTKAVLVRPDGHILHVCGSHDDESIARLRQKLRMPALA
ncbi:MAG: FAD-dependent monooxygenase [Beijerinckiaceae bacterium]